MRKVVILTLVTLFTCVEYSQAQTTEKEMTRQEKKAAQEALDKAGSAEGGVSDDDLKALKKELQDQRGNRQPNLCTGSGQSLL